MSELINPLHEDKPASTWKLPRCFCPTHFNISLDLEISKEKGVGRKVWMKSWGGVGCSPGGYSNLLGAFWLVTVSCGYSACEWKLKELLRKCNLM